MSSSKSMKAAHTAALSQQKTPPSQKTRATATADKVKKATKSQSQEASAKQLVTHPVKDWSEAGDLPEPTESDIQLIIEQQLQLLKGGIAQELTEDLAIAKHALDDSHASNTIARTKFLSQLTHIRLDRQGLTSLGDNVLCHLPNVTHIYLQHNRLTSLKGLSNLPCLKFAAVGYNNLQQVEDIVDLTGLLFLDVSYNRIQQLDVLQLPKCIRFLKIEGNPFMAQPDSQTAAQQAILQHIPQLRDLDGPLSGSSSDNEEENTSELDQTDGSQHTSTVTRATEQSTRFTSAVYSQSTAGIVNVSGLEDSRQLLEALQQLDAAETDNMRGVEKSQLQRRLAQTSSQSDSRPSSRQSTSSSVRLVSGSPSLRASQTMPAVTSIPTLSGQIALNSLQEERSRNSIADRASNSLVQKQLSTSRRSSIGHGTYTGTQNISAVTKVGCHDANKEINIEQQIDADLEELRQQLEWLSEPLTSYEGQAKPAVVNDQQSVQDTNIGLGKARVGSARGGNKEGLKNTTRPISGLGNDAAPGHLRSAHAACQALHSELDRMLGAAAERLSQQRQKDVAATTDIRNLKSSVSMASALKSGVNLKLPAEDMPGAISAVRDAVSMHNLASLQTAGELARDVLEQYAQRAVLHPGSRPASSHDPLRASIARLQQYSTQLGVPQGNDTSPGVSLQEEQSITVAQQPDSITEGSIRSKYYQAIVRATAGKQMDQPSCEHDIQD